MLFASYRITLVIKKYNGNFNSHLLPIIHHLITYQLICIMVCCTVESKTKGNFNLNKKWCWRHNTSHSAFRKKRDGTLPTNFVMWSTIYSVLGTVPFTFSHCMEVVAAPNSNVMRVNMPRWMESGFVTEHIFGCKK